MGEEEWKESLSTMSRLVISVRLGIILEMWCFEEELRIWRNWGSPVLQKEGNTSRANDSSASREYESQSAFLR